MRTISVIEFQIIIKDGILLGIPMHVFFAFSLLPLSNEAVSLYLPPDIGKAISKIAVGLRLLQL